MDPAYALSLLMSIAYLVLNSTFLYYMYGLKSCTCALSWRRSFLIASLFIYIVFSILTITVLRDKNASVLSFILFIWTILYVIVTRQFINSVERKECTCAETTVFKILNIVNIIQIFLLIVVAISMIAVVISILSSAPKIAGKIASKRR